MGDLDGDDWFQTAIVEEESQQSIQMLINYWILPTTDPHTTRPRGRNIERDRVGGDERIWRDYFAETPVYTDQHFRRRFRMRRQLFLQILERVTEHDVTFQQRSDATGLLGLSSIQKMTAALRMLAYGAAADQLDEYIRIGESTALLCLKQFCKAIVDIFSAEYLRSPTVEDTRRILAFNQSRGFPGMMGAIDCMHWQWKNCPRGWAGAFQGKSKKSTVVLEAIASYDLWIWHAFFGMPGSLNDLNVLARSDVFQTQVEGVAPTTSFRVNGNEYTQTYLLADGIYPQWATFVQTIKDPQGEKRKHFAKMQEAARKDVERCFGVLQARWAIIREPARTWSLDFVKLIMRACIILHNMIVKDESGLLLQDTVGIDLAGIQVVGGQAVRDTRLPSMHVQNLHLRDSERHYELRHDLIEHLWSRKGDA